MLAFIGTAYCMYRYAAAIEHIDKAITHPFREQVPGWVWKSATLRFVTLMAHCYLSRFAEQRALQEAALQRCA